MTADDAIVQEFLAESRESLDQLDRDLVALEAGPGSRELLDRAFRVVHTLKGTCGFLGFPRLEALAHAAEGLMARVREEAGGSDEPASRRATAAALLETVDAVRTMLAEIERDRRDGDDDHAELIATLNALARPGRRARAGAARRAPEPARAETPSAADERARPEASLRVDVTLLDRLMNLVGELVLARNQLVQLVGSGDWRRMPATAQRVDHITSRLQDEIMRTRMQPIGTAWAALPRLVRDVAAEAGKEVRLQLSGGETELDKTVIDAIRDPLTHLVRNAVDHGIEPPAARAAAGKPRQGVLRLKASHRGGQVLLEIADDGAGLPIERIRRRALERSLVTAERAAQLGDQDWIEFVFQPGFSTAERVTRVSGRGVGMDVVRTNVERIGGAIAIESREGRGTTLRITIPLTLAIVPALVVSDGGERYAIPQLGLLETVRLEGATGRRRIESFGGAPVFRLRGALLPLVSLRRLLDTPPLGDPQAPVHIVVVQAEGRVFGLLVDQVHDAIEIVVKPLPEAQRLGVFAGVTVLGDGRVCLILDLPGLARQAGLPAAAAEAGTATTLPARPVAAAAAGERLLLARVAADWPVAIPLAGVRRLEEIPFAALERPGGREVVRYRGAILPLVRLASALDPATPTAAAGGPLHVVIHDRNGATVGIVVEELLDIVEQAIELDDGARRPGIRGSAVIRGRVTDLVDLDELLAATTASGGGPR